MHLQPIKLYTVCITESNTIRMLNMNELISIIVPIYKVEKYLDKCIEAIVNQTYKNLEIILIDDGSTDNCPAICDKWAEKDNRIVVIHKENGGLSDARNAGIAVATGDYIGFVDSDDYIEPDMYEKLLGVIHATDSDIASCNLRVVYENGDETYAYKDTDIINVFDTATAMSALIDDSLRQVVWNKLYKNEIVKKIPFDVGKCHEDEFWSYKAIGKASKVSLIEYTGYNYLQRKDSIMGNSYSLKRLDAIEAKCLRQEYLNKNFPVWENQGLKDIIFTCVYHGQLALKYLKNTDKKTAIKQLKKIIKQYISSLDTDSWNIKQKIWICLIKMSFVLTCKIRNLLRIGL